MSALHHAELDDALMTIDRGHSQLLRDRDTLDAVRKAVDHLTAESDAEDQSDPGTLTIGELAHQLGVTAATVRNWESAGILAPARDPVSGYRVFRPSDIRDAALTHLLRRGGYRLDHISTVVHQIRTAGGTEKLSSALDDWHQRLTAQGLAMLHSATQLSHYLSLLDRAVPASATSMPATPGPFG
jgi:DNA-binding transcriptional MerR regulator